MSSERAGGSIAYCDSKAGVDIFTSNSTKYPISFDSLLSNFKYSPIIWHIIIFKPIRDYLSLLI